MNLAAARRLVWEAKKKKVEPPEPVFADIGPEGWGVYTTPWRTKKERADWVKTLPKSQRPMMGKALFPREVSPKGGKPYIRLDRVTKSVYGQQFEPALATALEALGWHPVPNPIRGGRVWDFKFVGPEWHKEVQGYCNTKQHTTKWLFQSPGVYRAIADAWEKVQDGTYTETQAKKAAEAGIKRALLRGDAPRQPAPWMVRFIKPKDRTTEYSIIGGAVLKDKTKARRILAGDNFSSKKLGRNFSVDLFMRWRAHSAGRGTEDATRKQKKVFTTGWDGSWQNDVKVYVKGGVDRPFEMTGSVARTGGGENIRFNDNTALPVPPFHALIVERPKEKPKPPKPKPIRPLAGKAAWTRGPGKPSGPLAASVRLDITDLLIEAHGRLGWMNLIIEGVGDAMAEAEACTGLRFESELFRIAAELPTLAESAAVEIGGRAVYPFTSLNEVIDNKWQAAAEVLESMVGLSEFFRRMDKCARKRGLDRVSSALWRAADVALLTGARRTDLVIPPRLGHAFHEALNRRGYFGVGAPMALSEYLGDDHLRSLAERILREFALAYFAGRSIIEVLRVPLGAVLDG